MKKYKIDIKSFLKQANWRHPDFGVVASFFGDDVEWFVSEDELEEVDKKYSLPGETEILKNLENLTIRKTK